MTARSVRVSWLRDLPGHAWASSRPLSFVGAAMLLVLGVAVVGLLLDERVITGPPAWLKPMKFAVSISIYCFTLLWMLTFVRGRPRLVVLVSWVTAIALFVEMVLISGAAALDTTSHFNVSTPTHTAVWYTMAGFVALVWAMNLLVALLLLIQRMPYRNASVESAAHGSVTNTAHRTGPLGRPGRGRAKEARR
jgi:purine-cytosine permease-like protein